ncbi:MAG: hypothetical protein RIC19_07185 [Phaeodactylibacter sp.]|uniref:hypothetical protein n=1 Tax=Phaeodactylibacter sp. TaxID=1940289 RepID=UPI0032EC214A
MAAQPLTAEERTYFEVVEDSLMSLSKTLLRDTVAGHRLQADAQIKALLQEALTADKAFQYKFQAVRGISIQYPQDSTFRIFSWQLYVSENDYRYGGFLQVNTAEGGVYALEDHSAEVRMPEHEVMQPDYWYGAVYYNLKQFGNKRDRHYLLFGFDGYELFRKRKLIDVLVFKDGKPRFGAPVFEHGPGKVKHRIVREYSAEVSTHLNYDEDLEMIMFDHLIGQNGPHGEGLTYYPDGSYEAYKLNRKDTWEYTEKVFDQVSEEAPRPSPILDSRKKDIFGRGNQ